MVMLKKKMIRDLKYNKSQFITIFLMIFLGMFIFSGISSYMAGMRISADKYYEEYNFQDIWVMGKGFTEDDLSKIKQLDNIRNAEGKLTIIGSIDNISNSTAQINFIESNSISSFYVVEGNAFDKNVDGVWIDSYWAKNNNLKIGQKLTIRYEEDVYEKEIVGLILVPDHVYDIKSEAEILPTHTDYGFIYLSSSSFPYGKENISYNQILVDVTNSKLINQTKMDIENKISNWLAVTDRNDDVSSQTYEAEIEEGNTYVGIFSGIFLFIAVLSVITTMNRLVKKQRTEIGILKALGFKNRKITLLYVGYGFWISLFASTLGIVLGPLTIGNIFLNMLLKFYAIPKLSPVITRDIFLVSILVVTIVSTVTYLSCRKELKEKATDLLKSKVPNSKNIKTSLNKGIFKNANFSTIWNIRDMLRSKVRTFMGIAGITGCCALIICAFGMLNTMNDYFKWQFDELYNFKYKITLNENYSIESLDNIISLYGDNTSKTLDIELIYDDKKEINTITVDDSSNLLKYTDKNRNFIELDKKGIYVTIKLAERLNLKIGDRISWHLLGTDIWQSSTIIGFNRSPQIQNITMTRKYLESIGIDYKPDSIYTNNDLSDINDLSGSKIIQDKNVLKQSMESMIETIRIMIILIIVAAIVLGIVIIYNLGELSFIEKTYQFATLKVLGFKTRQIRKVFTKQNLWITLASVLLGAPIGYYITDFIFKKLSISESFDMMTKVDNVSYFYGIVGTLIVSLIVNKVLSRKIKNINMVESLKASE